MLRGGSKGVTSKWIVRRTSVFFRPTCVRIPKTCHIRRVMFFWLQKTCHRRHGNVLTRVSGLTMCVTDIMLHGPLNGQQGGDQYALSVSSNVCLDSENVAQTRLCEVCVRFSEDLLKASCNEHACAWLSLLVSVCRENYRNPISIFAVGHQVIYRSTNSDWFHLGFCRLSTSDKYSHGMLFAT